MAKNTANTDAAKRLKVTLVRSTIGFNKTQEKTVEGWVYGEFRHRWSLPDTPEKRGMIHKVRHRSSPS